MQKYEAVSHKGEACESDRCLAAQNDLKIFEKLFQVA